MIPAGLVDEWRQQAPWSQDVQVEQDLILSRALVELFEQPAVATSVALRGGTALFKLHIRPALRYSEDIDLVQLTSEPIGPTLDAIRQSLDPWLGAPRRKFGEGRVTLIYRVESEGPPPLPLRLKVEINSREHFSVFGVKSYPFAVRSRWFQGGTALVSYHPDELLGTKPERFSQDHSRGARDLRLDQIGPVPSCAGKAP